MYQHTAQYITKQLLTALQPYAQKLFSQQFSHTHLIRLNKDDTRPQGKLKANTLLVEDDICQWINKLAET